MFSIGYTDPRGTELGNIQLSALRALAVKRGLIARGIPGDRVVIQALGESDLANATDPLAGREPPSGHQVAAALASHLPGAAYPVDGRVGLASKPGRLADWDLLRQALAAPPARVHGRRGRAWPGGAAAVFAALLAATLLLLLTAPVNDDFWWQDAPRHALNGAFVKDFFAALPWRDPFGWAASYYIKYPSLTIGFYPPLFYLFEAAFYAVFGVNQFVAQATVACFTLLLGSAPTGSPG